MRFLKKYLPKSLYRRTLLILILPTIVVQSLTVYIFYERHWKNVSRHLASSLAGEISTIVAYTENAESDAARQKFLEKSRNLFALSAIYVTPQEADNHIKTYHPVRIKNYHAQLKAVIGKDFSIYNSADQSQILTRVNLKDGNVLLVEVSDKRLFDSSTYIFIIWMLSLTVVFTLIAVVFLRNQIRPIIRLARLADNFGRGQDLPASFKPEGAKEIRQAANAFLVMRERIGRHLRQRTEMLAGISHDLRTPLTRMKLEISMLKEKSDSEILNGLASDVAEMESMVNSYLEFVRGDEGEEFQEADLGQLIENVIGKYTSGKAEVKFDPPAKAVKAKVRAFQLSRVVNNLIDNALKYGTKAHISLVTWQDAILIIVDDNGPGIPAAVREDVFRPFYRMEQSRNKATGGIGLGLSIVRDIVNAHGGTVELSDSEYGGLRAVVKLPK